MTMAAVSITVEPEAPSCDEQVTISVIGNLSDLCWVVTDIEFVVDGTNLGFVIHALDHWEPGSNCSAAIYSYSDSVTIGPLPSGSFIAYALEIRESLRDPGETYVWTPFEACCEQPPLAVTDLELSKIPAGPFIDWLRFTWTDPMGAELYHLYKDVSPQGDFDEYVRTVTSGDPGIDRLLTPETTFYLISTTNSCSDP